MTAPAILYVVLDRDDGWVCYSATSREHARWWMRANRGARRHRLYVYDLRARKAPRRAPR